MRESDLSVAYNPMNTTPHLLIFGAPKSGKTRIAHAVAQAICARNSPSQVRFMLADFRSGLLDAVPESHLLDAGAVNRNTTTLDEAIKALAINLQTSGCHRPTSPPRSCGRGHGGRAPTSSCWSTTGT